MYEIEFYEKQNGESDVWDFLESLRIKGISNKDARIQYNQAIFYIDLLSRNGTSLPTNITKHIEEDIWELRPGNNRIFYFYYDRHRYVLLHHFRKKSQKTPKREISLAKAERDDYIRRKEVRL
ncbi:type II toxin-antitoxin system RelE/ParE family toxin [Megasphaera coli]|uniref:type II toxin-antitoxin system RelE/ParE family toxin n=1 Tax=Colibacter massiliensis TaxID=1852379 RepID=UPI00094EB849|nr:type II toxin-antitoxin system RelE/ParE family toxin [Colibacter massiliensis]